MRTLIVLFGGFFILGGCLGFGISPIQDQTINTNLFALFLVIAGGLLVFFGFLGDFKPILNKK